MGSGVTHFNVSLILEGKGGSVTWQRPYTTTYEDRPEGQREPDRNRRESVCVPARCIVTGPDRQYRGLLTAPLLFPDDKAAWDLKKSVASMHRWSKFLARLSLTTGRVVAPVPPIPLEQNSAVSDSASVTFLVARTSYATH